MTTQSKEKLCKQVKAVIGKDVSAVVVAWVVEEFLTAMHQALLHGDRIEIRNFGVLKPYTRKASKCTDPRYGTPMEVPPKRKVKFIEGKKLSEALNAARSK